MSKKKTQNIEQEKLNSTRTKTLEDEILERDMQEIESCKVEIDAILKKYDCTIVSDVRHLGNRTIGGVAVIKLPAGRNGA